MIEITRSAIPAAPPAAPARAAAEADPVFRALAVDRERTRSRLIPGLRELADVVWNYAWSWLPDGPALFREIDPALWESSGHNARAVLEQAAPERLAELAADPAFLARARALRERLDAYLARPPEPAAERYAARQPESARHRPIAYFSAEFGIHESLPIYAGGLGVLAGDHLKSASDLGVPIVGVGLRYQQGYFRQSLDGAGWQQELYGDTDFGIRPLGLLLKPDRTPLTVDLPIGGRRVVLQLWGARVGRASLLLLDSNRDDNDPVDRWITAHLYGGGRDTRLAQEMVLGIGGVRALRLLGYDPAVFHMNEGHAAFLALELLREELAKGRSWAGALEAVRTRTVFTTHTPVAAGHDVFEEERFRALMGTYVGELQAAGADVTWERVLALGRVPQPPPAAPGVAASGSPPERTFGMTPLAIQTARSTNAVSRLHGKVAREMWSPLWPERPAEEAPIGHVTNGVHLPTWMAPLIQDLLARALGGTRSAAGANGGWLEADPALWEAIDAIPDEALWEARCRLRRRLVEYARARARQCRSTGASAGEAAFWSAAAEALDPDALTLGFARRVATYKRLGLLLHDPDRLLALLDLPGRPVQLLLAGKAHPGDLEAKRLLQSALEIRRDPRARRRTLFLPDYDIAVARELVHGCDVWLNVPRRPLEASGTSGMKAALNGGVNCSVLDGWWAEAYNGRNGWAVGEPLEHPDAAEQDRADAESLYRTLEQEVVPLFYDRDAAGLPRGWIAKIRESMKTIGPIYTTRRMVEEYVDRIYAPEP